MLQWTQEEAKVQSMGSRQATKEDGDCVITCWSHAKRSVTEADVGMFSIFGWTGASQKGAPWARDCRTAMQHLCLWGLFMTCCNI